MIQFATESMLPALKGIWSACFGDPAEYVDTLFERLLRPAHVLVDVADGAPAAMLCIEPAVYSARAGDADAAYLFGVATLPERQGEGRSTALLEACHAKLAEDGFALSMLVPANERLFGFYSRRGYATGFSIAKPELADWEIPAAQRPCVLTPAKLEEMAGVRGEVFRAHQPFVRWSREYLRYIGEECVQFGGEVLQARCGGETGYVVCYRHGGEVTVKELAMPGGCLPDVMAALHARYRARRYRFYMPADTPDTANRVLPFAMVRWYDKEKQELLVPARGETGWIAHVLD